MNKKVFLNGEFVKPENATVSVFDRGFLFADAVYEVVQVYKQKFFLFHEHIERLQRSLNELQIPMPDINWLEVCRQLITDEDVKLGGIYIQITRGQQIPRSHFWQDKDLKPFSMALLQKLPEVTKNPLKIMTYPDQRWQRCDIKTTSLLPNVLARQAAAEKNCDEALLVKDKEWVSEGSASNIFMVKNQKILTPPLTDNILPGITRSFCVELFKELNLNFEEKVIRVEELVKADELWLTSATKDVLPVSHVNGESLNWQKAGSLWEKLSEAFYNKKVSSLIA